MSAHTVRGAGGAALLLTLALFSVPALAQFQAGSPQWSTYVGGSDIEVFYALAQDPATQDIVAVGVSASTNLSPATRTPTTPADAMVSIFTKAGVLRPLANPRHVIFGGVDFDQVTAVAIGSERQIYVVGRTRSPAMSGFTTIYRAYGGSGADFDGFLAELSPDGEPRWFMYLGAQGDDVVLGVASVGTSLYITGSTSSSTTVTSLAIGYSTPEAFVAKLDTTTTPPKFTWNQTLTGPGTDEFSGITLDSAGNLYVTGTLTSDPLAGVPNTNSFQGGSSDAAVMKLSPTGEIAWLTYLGGTLKDTGHGIALGPEGEVVVAGSLESPGNGTNALVVRLNSAGVEQERRQLGGVRDDTARSVAVDAGGNVYVAGAIGSAVLAARGGYDPMFEGPTEGFVAMLPGKGGPGWASYVGGSAEDFVHAVRLSSENRLVLAGTTQSSNGLPASGGHDTTFGGLYDGLIVAVDPDTTPPVAGKVYDRPGADEVHQDVSQQTSLTTLSANWEGFSDNESAVVEYEWAIGTEAAPESLKPFTAVAAATSATAADLKLEEGTTYFITVRATNGAGLVTTVRSDGVKVTAPVEEGGDDQNPVGWSCSSAADASLPLLVALLTLALRGRRSRVSPP